MNWPFPVWYFFSIALSKSVCISAFGPSSSLSSSLVILFIHSAILLCLFGCHILVQIVRFLLHPVVGMFPCHLLPLVGKIFFRYLGSSSFICIVSSFVDISLILLLSPELSGLFPQVVLLFFPVLPFPFSSNIFLRLFFCLIILTCLWRIFICVSSRISYPGFDFFLVLSEEIWIFSQNNFASA